MQDPRGFSSCGTPAFYETGSRSAAGYQHYHGEHTHASCRPHVQRRQCSAAWYIHATCRNLLSRELAGPCRRAHNRGKMDGATVLYNHRSTDAGTAAGWLGEPSSVGWRIMAWLCVWGLDFGRVWRRMLEKADVRGNAALWDAQIRSPSESDLGACDAWIERAVRFDINGCDW